MIEKTLRGLIGRLSSGTSDSEATTARKFVRVLWVALTVLGLLFVLWDRSAEIGAYFQSFAPETAAASIVLALAAKYFVASQVRDSLVATGHPTSLGEALKLYSYADIAKYVPGGIWGVVSRIGMYRDRGMPMTALVRALALDHLWLIGGAFVVGSALFARGFPSIVGSQLDSVPSAVLWGAPFLLIAAWVQVLRVVHPFLAGTAIATTKVLGIVAKHIATWVCMGASFAVLLAPAPLTQSFADLSIAIGAFALAFGLGFLAVFAPAGIGIREGSVAALLFPFYPVDTVLAASIASRVLLLVSDILFAAGTWSLIRRCRRDLPS